MEEPEPQLVWAARAGDRRAFEELVRTYQGQVYRLAHHLLRDRAAAEDVTQEAFLKAYRRLGRFRGDSKFSTWLFRIVRNCAVDAIRGGARQRRLADRAPEGPPATEPSLRAALSGALEGLPAHLREAFVLIEVFGLSYAEAAEVLGVVQGTLKSRMHRTRQLLIRALSEDEGGSLGEV